MHCTITRLWTSLALALVGRPQVAFLDEPAAGVDVRGRQLIRSVVRDLAHDGACVLLTTCLLYTSPSPRARTRSRMPPSA